MTVKYDSYWSPGYWKKYSKNIPFWTDPKIANFLKDVATQINDSVGNIYDSPERAIAAFGKINSKVGVSAVADAFANKYNVDLLNWLTEKFDTDAQKVALEKIKTSTGLLPIIQPGQ